MTVKKYANITVSIIALLVVLFIAFKYCGSNKKTYNQQQVDAIIKTSDSSKQAYIDSLDFVRGQLDLQQEKSNAQQDRVTDLEKQITKLLAKHDTTKQKLQTFASDTGFTLAPNEYINDCEGCFTLLGKYKKESVQLKFERDGYDSLMRQQNAINEKRIAEVNDELNIWMHLYNSSISTPPKVTRKIKLSLMGMFGNPFLPKGGGFGTIYEDKKFNDYAAHVVFTNKGNMYMINIAKTISFRRKK